jgi:hypothetical protein
MPRLRHSSALRRPASCFALAALLSGAVQAATSPAEPATPEASPAQIRPVAGVLVTSTVSNSNATFKNPDGTTATGSLAGRYEVFAGAEFPVDPNGLAIRLTAGFHVSATLAASNGASERFTRIPFEATLWYPVNDKLHVGGGMRYSLHPRFSGPGGRTSDSLSATPSFLAGVEYQVLPHLRVDGRYVYERFEQYLGADVEGSHWGLGLTAIY